MTKENAIAIVRNQIEDGQVIVYATIGQGGAGLGEEKLNDDFINELEASEFNGIAEPCDDIKSSEKLEPDCVVVEFGNNGLRTQIMTDVIK